VQAKFECVAVAPKRGAAWLEGQKRPAHHQLIIAPVLNGYRDISVCFVLFCPQVVGYFSC